MSFDPRGRPMPPELRPIRQRQTARVALTDRHGALLLICDTDPWIPGSQWFSIPGGGIEPGEGPAAAAIREVAEETGMDVTATLRGPVAQARVIQGLSDGVTVHDDIYFAAKVDKFDIQPKLTDSEQATIVGYTVRDGAELPRLGQLRPSALGRIGELVAANQSELWPYDFGVTEVSSLAAGSQPIRLTAFLAGRVQGVGMRWWIRARALELGLVGMAVNKPDRRVEVIAEGPLRSCAALGWLLRSAHTPGRVDSVGERYTAARGELTGFREG